MNAALVAGLVITSLLAGCEAQAAIKGQNVMYPPGPGTKGGGYFPDGGGYMPGAKGGMKGGGYKGYPPPQQPQFPMMPQQPQFPQFPPMGPPQRPMNPGQQPYFG
ncbi:calcium-binding protein P [Rhipicephalus sanguineus]|uniref:Uncharacterized protein n=1 Tax=Rhipicephalus sanguineus TaxID=34632 RepID=A0A9D4QCI0_RHISA|nr:calcium-binding protein P [Rhipicephalus sanguineus]KAH7972699.1 hypothetical protein HPB52_015694 [Rhipicephalus sanguineus]